MGFQRSQTETEERRRRYDSYLKGEQTKRRKKLADKIATVCIDMTVNEIIRPGPKPEERECYEVANELRAMKDQMIGLVAEVLRISEEED